MRLRQAVFVVAKRTFIAAILAACLTAGVAVAECDPDPEEDIELPMPPSRTIDGKQVTATDLGDGMRCRLSLRSNKTNLGLWCRRFGERAADDQNVFIDLVAKAKP